MRGCCNSKSVFLAFSANALFAVSPTILLKLQFPAHIFHAIHGFVRGRLQAMNTGYTFYSILQDFPIYLSKTTLLLKKGVGAAER